ncbi:hypothetical protein GUITHDRAFT_160564 [Guillardia theta CCMP2712]|uniref:Cytosol aminopeptidase domain-containing protein n=2 Tax=Guillardia theta TaxID=55529 RepID=L1K279_GUITC|nr:hypothetical protein GUITHDRAFT_160564 [Guillardia theta CCMP2712]EKX54931.1 hypothetical protein GUITHDRAFT_160564 [Guillardia theta CCMP2712]|eukprot:XP_005841911.1 hypothetical protein GUITHDRAFT_160564 [Guillardia theta CCMP2712]
MFVRAAAGGGSLEERACVVIGAPPTLQAPSLFQAAQSAVSPASEIDEASFANAVKGLDASDAGEVLPLLGKKLTVISLPTKHTRCNCPARPDKVPALLKPLLARKDTTVVVACPAEHVVALSAAVTRSCPPLFDMKSSQRKKPDLQVLVLVHKGQNFEVASEETVRQLNEMARAIRLAARLVDTPTNYMHTDAMIDEAKQVAQLDCKTGKVSMEVIRDRELQEKGFGGLWNVGKAAEHGPALVVLTYTPSDMPKDAQTVCWVGKGIVYDTGGLSIKGKSDMPSMKRDMGGSAAVLASFSAATQIGCKFKLVALLCLAENSVDSVSMRPDDIITMLSGKTVEVNNTDAEGRLVLADGVNYAASTFNPDVILDMATLTGAQCIATGKKHAAVLCNNTESEKKIVEAGIVTGDLVYPVVYCPEFFMEQAFRSEVADMKNSADDRSNALSSCAGHFIEAHLPESYKGVWIHIDMAKQVEENQRATGWGVSVLLKCFDIMN